MIPFLEKIKRKYFYKNIEIVNTHYDVIRKLKRVYGRYDELIDDLSNQILNAIIEEKDYTELWKNRISHIRKIDGAKGRESFKASGKEHPYFYKGHKNSYSGPRKIWCTGLTKENNESLRKISSDRLGENNPVHKIKDKVAWREKISDGIRKAIEDGKFTPKSNNRLTHNDIIYGGRFYRSTWECVWQHFNETHFYETIRIKYIDGSGKIRVTIPDFYDEVNKTIIEIKPEKEIDKNFYKIKGIEQYCKEHGMNFKLVLDQEIMSMCCKIEDFSKFNEKAIKIINDYIMRTNRKLEKFNENKKNKTYN